MQKRIHTKTHATKTNKRDLKIIFNYINNSPNRYDRRINRFSNWHKDYIQKLVNKFKAKFGNVNEVQDAVQTA